MFLVGCLTQETGAEHSSRQVLSWLHLKLNGLRPLQGIRPKLLTGYDSSGDEDQYLPPEFALLACFAVGRWQAQTPSRIAQEQHPLMGILIISPFIESAQRSRMLCTSSALLESLPSTSGRQCHAPATHPQAFSSHVPRTAAFSKQIRNRSRKDSRGQLQTLCAVKKKSEKNLVCSKTLTVKPDHKDAVVDMCQQVTTCCALPHLYWLL